jgi:hypothetical protein
VIARIGSLGRVRVAALVWFFATLALELAIYLRVGRSSRAYRLAGTVGLVASIPYGVAVLFAYVHVLRNDWRARSKQTSSASPPGPHAPRISSRPLPVLWIVPALLAVNGACPYLGLKTGTAFAMYSNLRTEGSEGNHWFLPRWRLWNYQDQFVTILSSNKEGSRAECGGIVGTSLTSPSLHLGPKHCSYPGEVIALFELERWVQKDRRVEVSYSDRGTIKEFTYQTLASERRLHPWWLNKLMFFRPIDDLAGSLRCSW